LCHRLYAGLYHVTANVDGVMLPVGCKTGPARTDPAACTKQMVPQQAGPQTATVQPSNLAGASSSLLIADHCRSLLIVLPRSSADSWENRFCISCGVDTLDALNLSNHTGIKVLFVGAHQDQFFECQLQTLHLFLACHSCLPWFLPCWCVVHVLATQCCRWAAR